MTTKAHTEKKRSYAFELSRKKLFSEVSSMKQVRRISSNESWNLMTFSQDAQTAWERETAMCDCIAAFLDFSVWNIKDFYKGENASWGKTKVRLDVGKGRRRLGLPWNENEHINKWSSFLTSFPKLHHWPCAKEHKMKLRKKKFLCKLFCERRKNARKVSNPSRPSNFNFFLCCFSFRFQFSFKQTWNCISVLGVFLVFYFDDDIK